MKRRTRQPGVSFFAFQDIITAVVGIFVLITLIMILELIEKVEAASQTPAGDAAAIERLIDQTRADADRIEQQLAEERRQQDRENAAVVMSTDVSADDLRESIEDSHRQNRQLKQQLAAFQRQIDDAQSRFNAAMLEADSVLRELQSQGLQIETELAQINEQTEKLQSDDSPLYNDSLQDGRALVLIRLGVHPGGPARISMREGDVKATRQFAEVTALVEAIKERSQSKSHYMVLIAPGGARDFKALRKYFDATMSRGFLGPRSTVHSIRYGFDVIGADDEIRLMFEMNLP